MLGSAYPFDPSHPSARYIRWLVSKNLAPGVIVILHDGIADPSRSLAALEDILTAGEQKGLRFVTVGELLATSRTTVGSPFPAGPTHAILTAGQAPVAQLDRAAAF